MPRGVKRAEDVSRLLVEMFGSSLGSETGVIHVAAVAAADLAENRVLRITPGTPKSAYDAFVLSVSRARASFIVTTGRILREEPNLTHDYLCGEETNRALASWRRDVVGIREPVRVLVLTSGRDLDARHPVFSGLRPVIVYTTRSGARAVRRRVLPTTRIVAADDPNIENVIDFAVNECGANTVSIEAGPSTTRALYVPSLKVDELLLSAFHGSMAPSLLGGSFLSADVLHRVFRRSASYEVGNDDGKWSFHRFVR